MLNKKLILSILVLIIFTIAGINFVFKDDESSNVNIPQVLDDSDNSGDKITEEGLTEKLGPSLDRQSLEIPKYTGRPLDEVRYGQGFSDPGGGAIEKKRGDLKVLAAILDANPLGSGGVDDWIAVGVIKKFFNDFEGTRDAWEYAGVLYPNNALSFANLGNLYGFYLHNNVKAELNFRKAINNDPYQPSYYIGLADFYKNVYTAKKSEAPKVLLEGMDIIKDVNLVLALATYYRDEGDKTNALKYYQEVLKLSPNHPGIAEEIDRLR
ncbi:MAG: hypothetical protein HY452_00080 [Parcubacteria group bacterium]|uniref:Tetratricopeptide repeat protein n=1 Tax=Candidatus Sungiibacteriota bacterium TaxID=2750080 RepID=A0A931YDY9_9BACT|nr:hypothetical protein [Candidatus Sungbacteria bacterium]MBI4118649.1 hypothetical protein [Parcubacteria group bacterium]